MPEQGGYDRTITHAELPKSGLFHRGRTQRFFGLQQPSFQEILKRLDELEQRMESDFESILDYLKREQFILSAAMDQIVRQMNELPVMDWLPFGVVVNAGMSSIQLNGALSDEGYVAAEDGSIIALGLRSTDARTAGTLTIEPRINGTGTGLTLVLDGTDTTSNATIQDQGRDVFAREDRIDCIVTTTGDWTPNGAEIMVNVGIVSGRGAR